MVLRGVQGFNIREKWLPIPFDEFFGGWRKIKRVAQNRLLTD